MSLSNEGIAVVNGKFSPVSEAKISITDRGFLFGHSVFETILILNGKMVAWENHFQRLEKSCKRSYIQAPKKDIIEQQILAAIEKNNVHTKMALRLIVTGGNSLDLPIKKNNYQLPTPNIIIICRNIMGPSQEKYEKGIKLKTFCDVRPKELIDIKSCNYLFNIMSLEESQASNYDDVLFYDTNNQFTECSTANFIWFDENLHVYSAPFKNNCLAGTTLTLLVEALQENGSSIKFHWKSLERNKLGSVSGCAILSSTRLILPVQKIDDVCFSVDKHSHFFDTLMSLLKKRLY
ncbi:MAG: aminotransferase class IV [Bdellovibrionota bacterium]